MERSKRVLARMTLGALRHLHARGRLMEGVLWQVRAVCGGWNGGFWNRGFFLLALAVLLVRLLLGVFWQVRAGLEAQGHSRAAVVAWRLRALHSALPSRHPPGLLRCNCPTGPKTLVSFSSLSAAQLVHPSNLPLTVCFFLPFQTHGTHVSTCVLSPPRSSTRTS